ncbi:hypothetical protein PoB_001504600 [Plakobranchus ocellatus]|uniref:Uncharacterized protein n=1 Tax=Plakobranchus ocellatus TaxID=259542 RepID=A0AAV3Z1U6_9GAST|nr:hypothetical protein PoB_001504600 [Plakobranchus ocellatus]
MLDISSVYTTPTDGSFVHLETLYQIFSFRSGVFPAPINVRYLVYYHLDFVSRRLWNPIADQTQSFFIDDSCANWNSPLAKVLEVIDDGRQLFISCLRPKASSSKQAGEVWVFPNTPDESLVTPGTDTITRL